MSHTDDSVDAALPPSIAEIEALHERMRSRARAGRWASFAELLARRDRLLAAFDGPDRAAAFTAALACNEAVSACARADRDAAGKRLNDLGQRRAVDSYYRSNGGSDTEL